MVIVPNNLPLENSPFAQAFSSPLLIRAIADGFNCFNCNREQDAGFVPIRRNDNGPFFCSFLCAFDFAGKNGDPRSEELANRIRGLRKDNK